MANHNLTFDQIDLFFEISSTIMTLKNLPIDRQQQDFKVFNSYIKPSYDNLINSTKVAFHQEFQSQLEKIYLVEMYSLLGISFIALVFLVFLLFRVIKFLARPKVVMKVLTEVKNNLLKKIYFFYRMLFYQYKKLNMITSPEAVKVTGTEKELTQL